MSRAIDADAAIKEIKARNPDDVSYEDAWAITCIEHAPTIEPERNKGQWEMVSQHDNPPYIIYSCSECGHKSFGFYSYCPNCGADMREDGESDDT